MQSKKRVMLFFPHLNKIGGVESCMLQFCERFHNDYDITIGYDMKSDKGMIKRLSKYAKVEKQDTYIETDVFIQCTMYEVKSHFIDAKKIMLWVHCIPFIYPNSILENKEFMKLVDEVVCVSEYTKSVCESKGIKAKVIYNDFDVEAIRQQANEYQTKEYDYCYVGRLSTEKGIHRLPKIAKKNRQKKMVIVGCPYEQTELMEAMLDQYNIERVGNKDNPYPYMKNSKFVIVPSNFESWGNVITEALIIGTPVIATDFPTAHEQIQDGVNGYIIRMDLNDIDRIRPLTIQPQQPKSNYEEWKKII